MFFVRRRVDLPVAVLALLLLLPLGCSRHGGSAARHATPVPDAAAVAAQLQAIAAGGHLAALRWPDFSHDQQAVQQLYAAAQYHPVWLHQGVLTPQATAMIAAFQGSQQKGLNPEDYDASRWPQRLAALQSSRGNADVVAQADAALTICAMRYLADLHSGRVNPRHFQFDMEVDHRQYDLAQFLLQQVVAASNVAAVLGQVEPQYAAYQRTEAALQHYLKLAAEDHSAPLPEISKTVAPGDTYAGIPLLAQRLRLVGDLPAEAVVDTAGNHYDGTLVEAIKRFQQRHGLEPDGRIGKETLRQLNVPLQQRLLQLDDALERWRWLPPNFPQPPVVVNVPEFVLRVISADHQVVLRMKVVVGKAVRHQTPVFTGEMKYIIFRPYWNVPLSITRAEIVPDLRRNPNYLAKKDFEVTDQSGSVVSRGPVSEAMIAEMRSGRLLVRQRPGPANALGLVKFMFPNEYNVYLHSTPAPQLFAQSRRDFSHGCVRVEKPVELAEWLLRSRPEWTRESIEQAMQSGPDNRQVNLPQPVPVLIVYLTVIVDSAGDVHFFHDLYGHDRALNATLAKGRPYPQ